MVKLLKLMVDKKNTLILKAVANVHLSLTNAADSHPVEQDELTRETQNIDEVLRKIFTLSTFENREHLAKVLVQKKPPSYGQDHWAAGDNNNRAFIATALRSTEILGSCLLNDLYTPFGFASILNNIFRSFWSTHVFEDPGLIFGPILPILATAIPALGKTFHYSSTKTTDEDCAVQGTSVAYTYMMKRCWWKQVAIMFWNPRMCPAFMFFSEGVSKGITLILVGRVVVWEYGYNGDLGFTNSYAQGGLLLMLCTSWLYEYGQILDIDAGDYFKIFNEYFFDPWNILDIASNSCITAWAILLRYPEQGVAAQIALSVSAIPLALSLLEYLSASRSLGRLVMMIIFMLYDIVDFLWVFLVSALGFMVCLWGLFVDTGLTGYGGSGPTAIQLFAGLLANPSFLPLEMEFGAVNEAGIVVYIVFCLMAGILLINLLIARMSSTHDRLESTSNVQWEFMMVNLG